VPLGAQGNAEGRPHSNAAHALEAKGQMLVATAPPLYVVSRVCGGLRVLLVRSPDAAPCNATVFKRVCAHPQATLVETNAFASATLLDSATNALSAVCARAEGRLESLLGPKGELVTAERLCARYSAAYSALADLLDPAPPLPPASKAPRGILARALGRGAPPAAPDAAALYPPPAPPLPPAPQAVQIDRISAPAAENPFDNAPPPPLPESFSELHEPPVLPFKPGAQLPQHPPRPESRAGEPLYEAPYTAAELAPPALDPLARMHSLPMAAAAESTPFDEAWQEPSVQAPVQPLSVPAVAGVSQPVHLAPAVCVAVRHGGALEFSLNARGLVRGSESSRYLVCGGRVLRAGLRGHLELARLVDAAPMLSVTAAAGTHAQLWAHTRGASPGPAPHQFVLTGGPGVAYQLDARAAVAAMPLLVHAAVAMTADRTGVILAVRVKCPAGSSGAELGGVLVEAEAPSAAGGSPTAVSPYGEWDGAARVVRWRLQGAPPGGRALLRARFPAAAFLAAPVDAHVRVLFSAQYAFGSEL
jgi:hypothetical protein